MASFDSSKYAHEIEYLITNYTKAHKPKTIAHIIHMASNGKLVYSDRKWYEFNNCSSGTLTHAYSWFPIEIIPCHHIVTARQIYTFAAHIAGDRFGMTYEGYGCFAGTAWLLTPGKHTETVHNTMHECQRAMDVGVEFRQNLNTNKHLLVCTNGVLEFNSIDIRPSQSTVEPIEISLHGITNTNRSARFRSGKPSDMMTMVSKATYVPYNPDNKNIQHVESMLQQLIVDRDERESLLYYISTCMAGFSAYCKITDLCGSPSTGKSTFIRFVDSVLGEYSDNVHDLSRLFVHTNKFARIMFVHGTVTGVTYIDTIRDIINDSRYVPTFIVSDDDTQYVRRGTLRRALDNEVDPYVKRVHFKTQFEQSAHGDVTEAMRDAMLSILVNAFEPKPDTMHFWEEPLKYASWRQNWYIRRSEKCRFLHTELVATIATIATIATM